MRHCGSLAAMVLMGLLTAGVASGYAQQGSGNGSGGTGNGTGGSRGSSQGQLSPTPGVQSPTSLSSPQDDPFSANDPRLKERAEKMRNDDRQKKLVSDTEKLLSLANELKADVDKSDKNTLSMDVIRKADEIEKLARSVKDRMRGDN